MAVINRSLISGNGTIYQVTDGTGITKVIRINSEGTNLLNRNINNTQTAQTAIGEYLEANASTNQSVLQAGVDNILKQAKNKQSLDAISISNSGAGTAEITKQNFTALDNADTGLGTPTPVSESASILKLNQQAEAISFNEAIGKTTKVVSTSPEEQRAQDVRFREQLPKLNATIGGADLSVFYLTEAPVMEDVMDPNLTPDMWRKEIITFEMDNVLSLSYSTISSKYPVRTLGRLNPKAYTVGPRTIAGHMTFAVMAEDILSRLRARIYNAFEQNSTLIKQSISNNSNIRKDPNEGYSNNKLRAYWDMATRLSGVELLDSLPEFDILVMGINEYGVFSRFVIRQVSIIDENQYMGTTQPNIMNKVTFTALDLVPMASFVYNSSSVVSSLGTRIENIRESNDSTGMVLRGLSASDVLEEFDNSQIDSKSIAQLRG